LRIFCFTDFSPAGLLKDASIFIFFAGKNILAAKYYSAGDKRLTLKKIARTQKGRSLSFVLLIFILR
jgi:hypothetical protein